MVNEEISAENKQNEEAGFEAKLARLQDIVAILENENTPIEKALSVFEEGVALSKELGGKLDDIKQKIEILKKDAAGNVQAQPFQEES